MALERDVGLLTIDSFWTETCNRFLVFRVMDKVDAGALNSGALLVFSLQQYRLVAMTIKNGQGTRQYDVMTKESLHAI